MAVDTGSIGTVYTALVTSVSNQYTTLLTDNKIDAETYTKLIGAAATDALRLAADLVQKQEKLDAELKQAYVERVIKDKEAATLGLDQVLKTAASGAESVYTPKYEKEE